MFVREVADLFRQYADEQDNTFLTAAQVSTYCRLGYEEYYRLVQKISPESLVTGVNITLNGVWFYDLADAANPVRLLGTSLTHKRMLRLYRLALVDPTTGIVQLLLEGVNTAEEWQASKSPVLIAGFMPVKYFWSGDRILFSATMQGTVQVSYIPYNCKTAEFAGGIDWTKTGAGDNEFIDNFQDFHELIALLAYQRYAIRDGADNQQLQRQLQALTAEFKSYLGSGRNLDVAHVQQTW